jgi:ankyrin repeat protein
LIESEVNVQSNKDGQKPLSRASENGHEAAAKLLVDYGADVNAINKSG